MRNSDELLASAIDILRSVIAFDTTSRLSNLALVEWIEHYLANHGHTSTRVENADGSKSNLYATIGPLIAGGVVLSGHSDVVPVDGQDWVSDPFAMEQRGERLYGRGTCDMKGFIALALAAVPYLGNAVRPVHLAISYDEEVGCLGAPDMITQIARHVPEPVAVIVGEPTNMAIVTGHKGISVHEIIITGYEAHSSLTHIGVSANMAAVELMANLARLATELEAAGDPASPFVPPHATLTIGQIAGGTASNILAGQCRFVFDLRCPPGLDPLAILAPFYADVAAMDVALKRRHPGAGVHLHRRSNTPPLTPVADGPAEAFVRALTGDNSAAQMVSYAAEAGQFQQANFPTVICGPGSIEQAHQPNEYIEVSEMRRGAEFMARLVGWANG